MYAMTGGMAQKADLKLPGWLGRKARELPMYDGEAFPRWLKQHQWRWYSHDPSTLRMADSAFRPGGDRDKYSTDANFAYFNRRTVFEGVTFLDDVASGKLPEVSWIDPNFVDVRPLGPPGSNDDHPPSRVILGQELVLTILLALARNPDVWRKTMLLVTYDEHGGFYDHVDPRDYPCAGDSEARYGVRVPALVVSAWADHGVSHTVFDHTSIPKTILSRFADDTDREKAFEAMGSRTRAANDLGDLLGRTTPSDPPILELEALAKRFKEWKAKIYRDQFAEKSTLAEKAFEAVTDLQGEIIAQAAALRGIDLPPGKP
jgi:phospholipase C